MPTPLSTPDADSLLQAMHRWRTTHPRATLAEIEAEASRQVAALRRDLVAAVLPESEPVSPPICPDCGIALVRNGTTTRTVVTDHEALLPVTLPRWRCSVCGTELSPPC